MAYNEEAQAASRVKAFPPYPKAAANRDAGKAVTLPFTISCFVKCPPIENVFPVSAVLIRVSKEEPTTFWANWEAPWVGNAMAAKTTPLRPESMLSQEKPLAA